MVSDIKPIGFPVDHFSGKFVRDVFFVQSLAQLHSSTNNVSYVILARLADGRDDKNKLKWGSMPKNATYR